MKKGIVCGIGLLLLFSISCNLLNLVNKKTAEEPVQKKEILLETYNTSKAYLELRLRTENILVNVGEFAGYEQWNTEMSALISDWQAFEAKASELETMAEKYANQGTAFLVDDGTGGGVVYAVHLVHQPAKVEQKYELTNIFDNAPAGKKIATLAKYLGTDAKRAYALLQQEQGLITADAYNEAGDTFKKLETSAVVIKDTCKVAGFVVGTAISGGVGGTLLEGSSFIIGGADMVLEIGEDGANIALGDNNKVSAIIGKARKITEPVASILTIATTSFDKPIDIVNAYLFEADQLRSGFQEGKVLGISIPVPGLKKDEVETPAPTPAAQATEGGGQAPTPEVKKGEVETPALTPMAQATEDGGQAGGEEEARAVIASVIEPGEISEWFEENGLPMIKEPLTEAEMAEILGITLPNMGTAQKAGAAVEPTPFLAGGQSESALENAIDLSGAWAIKLPDDKALREVHLSCDQRAADMLSWVTIDSTLPLVVMSGRFEPSTIEGVYKFIAPPSDDNQTVTGTARMVNDEVQLEMTFSEGETTVFECDLEKHDGCEIFKYPGSNVCRFVFKGLTTPEEGFNFEGYEALWKLTDGTVTCTYDRAVRDYLVYRDGVKKDERFLCQGTIVVPEISAYIFNELPNYLEMFTNN